MSLCASSPAVGSGRSRCSARWMDPSYPVTGVGYWSDGARVRRRHLRSGRAPAPARRSDRVRAYIVGVVGHPYLATLLPLWLTIPSYISTTLAVLALLTRGGSELAPSGSSGTDQTERELMNLNGRERYSIPVEYGLHVLQPEQRPYSLDAPGMCISVDALEAGLRFPLHPLIEECLRWWRVSPNQVAPNSWRYLVVFWVSAEGPGLSRLGTCSWRAFFHLCKSRSGYYLIARVDFRVSGAPYNNKGWKPRYFYVSGPVWGFRLDWSAHPIDNASPYLSEEETILVDRLKGIRSSSCVIKEMVELWLVEAGLSPASGDQMDLGELRGMPKVASGKVPPTRPTAREVGASPAREVLKASLKRLVASPTEQAEDAVRRHKKIKVLTRRHKSYPGEGESRSRSKGKEPTMPSEEPEAPAGSEEGGASPAHERLRSMKNLFRTKVHKDDAGYYALLMSDLGHQDPEKEMKARW
ncbi:hypothetical protein B296_00028263, partial [Ensete ventricosum]